MKRKSEGWGFVALIALGAAIAASGCGTSALRTQTQTHLVTTGVVATAGETIDTARTEQLDAAMEAHPPGPERNAALDEIHAAWRPVGAALDSIRDLLIAWAEGLELAAIANVRDLPWESFTHIIARIVLLYDDIARMTNSLGVEALPELPGVLRGLATIPGGR